MLTPFLPLLVLPCLAQEPDWAALEGKERRQAWRQAEIDPKYESDFTAYTVGRRRLRVGLMNLDYGLLDNLQLGTAPLLFALKVPNIRGKVTAIQTEHIDLAFEATGAWWSGSWGQDGEDLSVAVWPLMLTGSWMISRKISLHLGYRWDNLDAVGSFDSRDLVDAIIASLGVDLDDELTAGLEGQGNFYGGGHVTLGQSRLGLDWRLNRRDSLVFQLWRYNTLNARIDVGVRSEDGSTAGGGSVRIAEPLEGVLAASACVAYQMTLPRFRFRVGLPLSGSDALPTLWLPQAFELYWLF